MENNTKFWGNIRKLLFILLMVAVIAVLSSLAILNSPDVWHESGHYHEVDEDGVLICTYVLESGAGEEMISIHHGISHENPCQFNN